MKRAVFFAALLVTTQANATLLDGKTVGYEYYSPSLGNLLYTAPATTVGAGVEYPGMASSSADVASVDIADTSITIDFHKHTNLLGTFLGGQFSAAPFNGFRFFDVNNTIDAFTSVTMTGVGIFPFVLFDGTIIYNQPEVTFDSNNIYVNWQSFNYFSDYTVVKLNINGSNNVPEPATLALLGLGLAGLSAVRRRKDLAA